MSALLNEREMSQRRKFALGLGVTVTLGEVFCRETAQKAPM
jgi:hypothetical protein